jgi:acyl-CoA thioesterase
MADTGMGAALYPGLSEDELCATVEIKIAYFLPVRGGRIACETKTLHRRKTVAFLESEITTKEGLAAKASGTYSIFKTSKENRKPGSQI